MQPYTGSGTRGGYLKTATVTMGDWGISWSGETPGTCHPPWHHQIQRTEKENDSRNTLWRYIL